MAEGVDALEFRRFMARWPTGVSVVTAREGETNYGLTVSAFFSVSLRPPLVLVSLSTDADTTPVIQRTHRFAINLLSADQHILSERFASTLPPKEKFRDLPFRVSAGGLPLLGDTLGRLECEVQKEYPVADHDLVLGEVKGIDPGEEGPPLLYFRSGYALRRGPDLLELPRPRE
ncbi:MAG: flavin reductase family protein [Thermoplasmata archaeon]